MSDQHIKTILAELMPDSADLLAMLLSNPGNHYRSQEDGKRNLLYQIITEGFHRRYRYDFENTPLYMNRDALNMLIINLSKKGFGSVTRTAIDKLHKYIKDDLPGVLENPPPEKKKVPTFEERVFRVIAKQNEQIAEMKEELDRLNASNRMDTDPEERHTAMDEGRD